MMQLTDCIVQTFDWMLKYFVVKTTTIALSPQAEELNYELTVGKTKEESINGRFVLALLHMCKLLDDEGVGSLESLLLQNVTGMEEATLAVKSGLGNVREKIKLTIQVWAWMIISVDAVQPVCVPVWQRSGGGVHRVSVQHKLACCA
ncbi:MAG: hypothetical protein P4M11_00995 [Candidatus Pacebacteria bacterium]|nr:hypothetical protein [Candidatus Paceibacterota bacterium]